MRSSWPFFSVSEIFEYVFLDSHTYSKAFFGNGLYNNYEASWGSHDYDLAGPIPLFAHIGIASKIEYGEILDWVGIKWDGMG